MVWKMVDSLVVILIVNTHIVAEAALMQPLREVSLLKQMHPTVGQFESFS